MTTMTADTSNDTRSCPSWCNTDHSKRFSEAHVGRPTSGVLPVLVRATHLYPAESAIAVYARDMSVANVRVQPERAENFAQFLEGLADATAAEIRETAAAVRSAARLLEEAK
jgi:hypothetical protein